MKVPIIISLLGYIDHVVLDAFASGGCDYPIGKIGVDSLGVVRVVLFEAIGKFLA